MRFPRGISYTAARTTATLLRLAVAGSISYLILRLTFVYLGIRLHAMSGIAIGVVSVFVWRTSERFFRHFVHPLVRQIFFRDFYNSRKVLSELRASLAGVVDLQAILAIVSSKARETLITNNVSVFLRDETANFVATQSTGLEEDFNSADLRNRLIVSKDIFGLDALSKELYPLILVSRDYASGLLYADPDEPVNLTSQKNTVLEKLKFIRLFAGGVAKHVFGFGISDPRLARAQRVAFRSREVELLRRLEAAAVVSIRISGEVFGFMTLGSRWARLPFSLDDQQLLAYIAVCAADAIKASKGLDAFSKFLRVWEQVIESPELTDVVNATLIAAADAINKADAGSIFLWDSQLKKLVVRAQKGFSNEIIDSVQLDSGQGYAGWVFREGLPLAIPDVRSDERTAVITATRRSEYTSALCVPLQSRGFPLGVLCLDGKAGAAPFEASDLERLQVFAHQAARAIFNAKLHEELYNLGLSINQGGLTSTDIFKVVTQSVFRLTGAQSANMFLLRDPHNPLLSLEFDPLISAKSGLDLPLNQTIKPRRRGMTQRVIQSGEACWIRNKVEAPGLNEVSEDAGVVASIGLPLIVDGRVNGVLFINYHREHTFTEIERLSLGLFADQAAFALNNARQRYELEVTDKVAWMGLLFPSMAHTIVQRTGTIANYVSALRLKLEDRDDVIPYLEGIDASLEELKDLREEALSLPHDHEIVQIDLNETLRSEITKWCESDPEITIDFEGLEEDEECIVRVDRKRFDLVLEVITINAVKAMQGWSEKRFTVSSATRTPWVIVSFTNTGVPIPREVADRLFEDRVVHSDGGDSGSGVGLLISRRIVRRYQGELELVKSDKSGTTFSLWLTKEGVGIRRKAWNASGS